MTLPVNDTATRPLHIAIVLPGLRAGGAERVVATLANTLVARGLRITLITFERADAAPYFALEPGVERRALDVRLPGGAIGARHALRRVGALRRALRSVQPDVALAFLTKTNVITLLAAAGSDLPVIVSERNNPERQHFNVAWRTATRLLYPQAAGFVAISSDALAWYPPRMRPNGVAIHNPVAPRPQTPRTSGGRKRLVAVGRLDPQKGFDLLITAFARIADRVPDWQLVIHGEGALRAELEAQCVREGVADRIVLPGLSAQPGSWLDAADAFVLSSRFEGWANALAEAIAAGVPAISFACRFGPAEMLRDGIDGLLVPPEDVDALAASLLRVMADDALRARLGRDGAAFAASHGPDAIADRWLAYIATVLDRRDRAPAYAAAAA